MELPQAELIVSASALCGAVAVVVAGVCWPRSASRDSSSWVVAFGLAGNLSWLMGAEFLLRAPQSSLRARLLLLAVVLGVWPWLVVALASYERRSSQSLSRWWPLLLAATSLSVLSALGMWGVGLDWLTGIGARPVALLTRPGRFAAAIAAGLGLLAVLLLSRGVVRDRGVAPARRLGALAGATSVTWIAVPMALWGYLLVDWVVSGAALSAGAAMVWLFGCWRERAPGGLPAPSRRLVYGAAAGSLVLVYLLATGVALRWTAQVGAQMMSAILPLAAFASLTGLALTVGSPRLRHRLWGSVGRTLFQGKHDYGEVWIGLTELIAKARSDADLVEGAVAFCRGLLCVSDIAIRLTDASGRLRRGGDWAGGVTETGDACEDVAPVAPVELPTEAKKGPAHAGLGDATLVFPMRVGDRLLGVLEVGSGSAVAPIDAEDRELLRHVTAQVASALELRRLGEEIADAREVGSFHRFSGFVVHDLKNLAAQQSFVLENAKRYQKDPSFVRDALAAFRDSTDRMFLLIARLRAREPEGEGTAGASDLAEVVGEVVALPRVALPSGCSIRVQAPSEEAACWVGVERFALARVLTNLLGNAIESLPPQGGEVSLSITRAAAAWRLEVADNGAGIPAAFLRDHLFRPFRTTKSSGLGIGLYQCKVIVDGAGGAIEVESVVGVGTKIVVTLPAGEPLAPGEEWSAKNDQTQPAHC